MATGTVGKQPRSTYEIAEALARTWESRRQEIEEVSTPVREWMLSELRLREGTTVLELASGTGDTGFDAAAIIGAAGRLITTDFSPSMLEAARRRGAERGVDNVEYRLVDAEKIPLESGSVDRVLCRFGYMLMDDPAAAFRETRRVLRKGGTLTLATWGALEHNPFFGIIGTALGRRGHIPPPEPAPAPGFFNLASPEHMIALLEEAGFGNVRTEEVSVRFFVPDADEYLSLIADTAGPVALALQELPDGERAEVKGEVEDALPRFTTEGGYVLPGVALCAAATS